MLFELHLIFTNALFEMAVSPTKSDPRLIRLERPSSAMTESEPSFGEYHRQGMACHTMADYVPLARCANPLALMSQTWFRLAQEAAEAAAAKLPFERCAA